MINIKLIEHIFKAASISRWNDYPRMANLVELDKQAHKFIIAYFIAKMEKDVDMRVIIEGGIFEFLSRVVVTDIRPDVYHEIVRQKKLKLMLGFKQNRTYDRRYRRWGISKAF